MKAAAFTSPLERTAKDFFMIKTNTALEAGVCRGLGMPGPVGTLEVETFQ